MMASKSEVDVGGGGSKCFRRGGGGQCLKWRRTRQRNAMMVSVEGIYGGGGRFNDSVDGKGQRWQ